MSPVDSAEHCAWGASSAAVVGGADAVREKNIAIRPQASEPSTPEVLFRHR